MQITLISMASVAALVVLTAWAGQSGAVTAVFEPSKDNTLYDVPTGAVSNGAGESLFAGTTASNLTRRAVLAFDAAGQLPPGSVINSASLTLTVTRSSLLPVAEVSIHPLVSDWGEGTSDAALNEGGGAPATAGDATWIHTFFPDEFWDSPGGDFDSVASASAAVGSSGSYSWSSSEVAADVQSWVDNPSSNFGWAVIGDESSVDYRKALRLPRESESGRPPGSYRGLHSAARRRPWYSRPASTRPAFVTGGTLEPQRQRSQPRTGEHCGRVYRDSPAGRGYHGELRRPQWDVRDWQSLEPAVL